MHSSALKHTPIAQITERVAVKRNLPFESWTEVLGSERLTGAALDRLTHRYKIIETKGESYRLHDAKPGPAEPETPTRWSRPASLRQTDNQPTRCRFRRSRASDSKSVHKRSQFSLVASRTLIREGVSRNV